MVVVRRVEVAGQIAAVVVVVVALVEAVPVVVVRREVRHIVQEMHQ